MLPNWSDIVEYIKQKTLSVSMWANRIGLHCFLLALCMYVDPNCRPFSYHCFKWETSSAPCLKKVVCTVFNFALYPPKWSYLKNLWLSIGNSMICSDIWHKYHEWYFEIVIQNFANRYRRVKFVTIWKYHEWYICQMSRTNHAIICLYYYPQKLCNFHM